MQQCFACFASFATLLRHVGCCKWSNVSEQHPTCCNRVAKCVHHVAHSNVAMRCVEMLRSFDRGFSVFSLISLCFNFRAKMANKILPIMADHQNLKVTAFYFTCMVEGLLLNHRNHMRYDVMQFEQSIMNTVL